MRTTLLKLSAAVLAVAASACAPGFRPFPLKAPLKVDPDKRLFPHEPEEYYSSFLWDGADQMMFRPNSRLWAFDPGGEALNVTAIDEVANSAWFTNRIGVRPVSMKEMVEGPCYGQKPLDVKGPWTVTGAKPNGANPGFPIKAADGRRYLLKFDGVVQGPRATSADVIVSKLYYAAGYSTPCNVVIEFDRSILKISPKAKSETPTGEKVKMTDKDLDTIFSKAIRLPDGRYRGSASLFLPGKPIGPFRYESTRDDDPNDVIDHEDRRDLRGTYVLAAWTNHFDSREQNTLDMWVKVKGSDGKPKGGYIQHSIIDFGDCFGSVWEPPMMGRRIGHSNYFALDHIAADFITFGLISRPWDTNRFGASKKVFGYYKVSDFVADSWRPGYPNPAMGRTTERDNAWMARILSRITPAHIRAAIEAGKIRDPALKAELTRVVLGRRQKLLARFLTRVSPLTAPVVRKRGGGAELCLEDLAITSGVVAPKFRKYRARAWVSKDLRPQRIADVRGVGNVCVDLPVATNASLSDAVYLVVDVTASTGSQKQHPARVHLYRTGHADYQVVGLQRPYNSDPPADGEDAYQGSLGW